MRRARAAALPLILVAGGAACPFGCAAPPRRYEYVHRQMGTRFGLKLYAPDEATATAARDAAFARIDDLNAALSDYAVDSELNRLSRTAGSGEAVKLSDDLWNVLRQARRWARRSGGAFDATVGPATRLWRRARDTHRMPRERRLEAARAAIGYRKLKLNPREHTATLTAPDMRLDLGGIAKGYAADEALAAMRRKGVDRALVDAGGDVTLGDAPPDRPGWRVSLQPRIEDPEPGPSPGRSRILIASNLAVATSGDAFQHVVLGGKRYSHIVDPRTALGLTVPIAATVIAPRGATADALASTVSVLGPEEGMKLIERTPGAAAIIVENAGGELRRYESRRLEELRIIEREGTQEP